MGTIELVETCIGSYRLLRHDAFCITLLTPSGTIFLVCIGALAVVWKALDVVAKSQGKKLPRKNP